MACMARLSILLNHYESHSGLQAPLLKTLKKRRCEVQQEDVAAHLQRRVLAEAQAVREGSEVASARHARALVDE